MKIIKTYRKSNNFNVWLSFRHLATESFVLLLYNFLYMRMKTKGIQMRGLKIPIKNNSLHTENPKI